MIAGKQAVNFAARIDGMAMQLPHGYRLLVGPLRLMRDLSSSWSGARA